MHTAGYPPPYIYTHTHIHTHTYVRARARWRTVWASVRAVHLGAAQDVGFTTAAIRHAT